MAFHSGGMNKQNVVDQAEVEAEVVEVQIMVLDVEEVRLLQHML